MLKAIRLRSLPEDTSQFPWTLEMVANFQELKFDSSITFFVGENGSGKSTMLEAIAAASNVPIAGSRRLEDDPSLSAALDLGNRLILTHDEKIHHGLLARSEDFIGFARKIKQDIQDLDQEIEEIKSTFTGGDIKLALGAINGEKSALLARYGKDMETLSHGEGFLTLFESRITARGLYLIDEPEAALSPSRQLTLISLILKKVKTTNSQFIIATHSPIMMAIPEAQIFHFDSKAIQTIDYHDTEHYKITKAFLDNPAGYLKHL